MPQIGEQTQSTGSPPGAPDPDQERPLGGYAALTAFFLGLCGAFAAWLRASDRELPERIDAADLALVTVATHKVSRMITKDKVMSTVRAPFTRYEGDAGKGEVSEEPRGRGIRRAVGELLICPYCLGLWVSSAFFAGLLTTTRTTRWIASVFTVLSGADVLQIGYKKFADTL